MVTPVKGMSTRAVQAEQTRQQILETAQRLFTELGYDATSLQMIADEMGLTKAAVYYHFRAKSDILHEAMQPGIQRLEALLDEAAAIRGRRARIEHLVNGFVDFLVQNRHYAAMASTDPAAKRNNLDGEKKRWPARSDPVLRRKTHRRRATRLRRPVLHPGVPARPGRPDRRRTARSPAYDDTAHVAGPVLILGSEPRDRRARGPVRGGRGMSITMHDAHALEAGMTGLTSEQPAHPAITCTITRLCRPQMTAQATRACAIAAGRRVAPGPCPSLSVTLAIGPSRLTFDPARSDKLELARDMRHERAFSMESVMHKHAFVASRAVSRSRARQAAATRDSAISVIAMCLHSAVPAR